MNHNLKLLIIGSLTFLVLASTGIGIYVWKMGKTTIDTSQTGGSTTKSTTPAVAKQEKLESVTITPDMRDADGNVDLSKVLENK